MPLDISYSKFVKSIAVLFASSSIAQVFPVLVSPILTRIYAPGDFGLFGIYGAILSIASVVLLLRYDLAILLPKNNVAAINVFALSVIIGIINSVVLMLLAIMFIYIPNTFDNFGIPNEVMILLPLNALVLGISQSLTYWLNRHKRFNVIGVAKISQSSVNVIIILILGLQGYTKTGLIIGWFFGHLIYLFFLIWDFARTDRKYISEVRLSQMKWQMRKYKEFPKINTMHALITSLTINLPVIIIENYFSPYLAGLYMLCLRIVQTPLSLVSGSMSQVINPYITEMYNDKKNIYELMSKILKKIISFSLIPYIVIAIFSIEIFSFLFGDEWSQSGYFFILLSPFIYLNFLTSPFSYLPMVMKLQKRAFIIEIVFLITKLLALFTGVYFANIDVALILFSVSGTIVFLYLLSWYKKIAINPV